MVIQQGDQEVLLEAAQGRREQTSQDSLPGSDSPLLGQVVPPK